MRLRYLHVRKNPPLQDVEVTFHHETVLGRENAIHFVVGVNGSGKSRMLYVLAETFLLLSRSKVPAYPVTLVYDLVREGEIHTICLQSKTGKLKGARLIDFKRRCEADLDWENLTEETLKEATLYPEEEGESLSTAYLPSILVAHTSGATHIWEQLFLPRRPSDEERITDVLDDADSLEEVGSLGLDKNIENFKSDQETDEPAEVVKKTSEKTAESALSTDFGFFIAPDELNLAVLCVTLEQAIDDFQSEITEEKLSEQIVESTLSKKRKPGLRGVLNAIDWLWPVSVTLSINWDAVPQDSLMQSKSRRGQLLELYQLATCKLKESGDLPLRRLVFDLKAPSQKSDGTQSTTGEGLLEILRGKDKSSPFVAFKVLRAWKRDGLLKDVSIVLRRRNADNLLLYDWLSDGERLFLGRMALFHLLKEKGANTENGVNEEKRKNENALLLLDEPETHFNDVWKREIVEIIDESLGNVASNAVMTTHSSIALTDVFQTEISLLKKDPIDGSVFVGETQTQSFGATPTEIMQDIFEAPSSVGQRAVQFLDLVLCIASLPKQAAEVWAIQKKSEVEESSAFQDISAKVRKSFQDGQVSEDRLLRVLNSIKEFTEKQTQKTKITVPDVLEALLSKLGAGYYQFEFRRRLRVFREKGSNASSN